MQVRLPLEAHFLFFRKEVIGMFSDSSTKRSLIVVLVTLLIGACIGLLMMKFWHDANPPKPEIITQTVEKEVEKKVVVDSEFVEEHLSNIGQLSTLEVQYMGVMEIEDKEGISFINKAGYSMLYTIEAQIGIEFDDINIDVSDTEVTVTVPEAKVLNRHADGTSLQFFDEKWSLFKNNSMNDVPTAVKMAEDNFDEQTDKIDTYTGIAKRQAELMVQSLLTGVIGDKKLVIK